MLLQYICILLAQFAQVEVPEQTKQALLEVHAEVDIDFVDWHKKWGKFIAKFVDEDQIKQAVYFDEQSKWLYTKEEVFFNAVDQTIMDGYLNSKYANNSKLLEIALIKMPGNKMYYEFEVELFDFKKHIYFDKQGQHVELKLR